MLAFQLELGPNLANALQVVAVAAAGAFVWWCLTRST
jgi:hypothetical protein